MYSLPEISDALKERVTFRIGMGQETVFMTTEYGDVAITDKCVMYPGNPYEFARRGRVLADYCDSIIEGVEKYSSPEMRIKKMLDEMSRHKYDISAIKVLWFESEHGRVLLDGGHVRYPGNPKCFSRDAMTLQEWCAFLLDGIDKYSNHRLEIKYHKANIKNLIRKLSGLHDKWVDYANTAFRILNADKASAILVKWAQLLKEMVIEYSKMFEADVQDVQVEKMRVPGKYKAREKTVVLDANLISWSLDAVQKVALYYICRSLYPKDDVVFWYALEQMCVAASLIKGYGKVEDELFNQVRTQEKINIRKFELYGNESEFFIDRSEQDIYYSTWGNDYYYPCHRRLMQECLRIISPDDM